MSRYACPICTRPLLGTADGFRCEHCARDWDDEDVMPERVEEPERKKTPGLAWHKPKLNEKLVQKKLFED